MGAISGEDAIAIANQYTEESLAGAGAVAGVPCQIQSITDITGGHKVTFLWVDNNGDSHTSSMDVLNGVDGQDGEDGADGKGIKAVTINEEGHLIITYSDDTTSDAGKIEIQSAVDSVNGKTGAVTLDASDVGALPDDTAIPTKTSNLTNDSGFITKAVNDLVNYYLKSETYSKTEVDGIVTAIKNSRFEVVATLPTTDIKTNVIYLVPKSTSQTSNVKDEYINLDGTTSGWEKIGDTEIDLSNYVTTQALNTALADYTTTTDLTTLLAGKQDTLTFDNVPTENSNNPVKSGGVYSADDKIYQVMGQNSAKNFIPFDLDRIKAKNTTGTWNGNVYSVNGIDFSFNSDGTVDASGTATETASVHYYDPVGLPPFGGDRILRLTGCPSGGSGTTYKVMAYRAGEVDGSTGTAEEYGDGISLRWLNNGSGIKAFISISVYTGAGTIDLTFKPMLRLSTDTDNTFAPYAKTNKQLTQENQTLTNQVKDMNNVYGAKNVLDLTARLKKGFPTSSAIVSFSNEGIVLNGTVSGSGNIRICPAEDDNSFVLPQGTYVLSHKDGPSPSGTGITLRKNGTALTNGNRLANPYEFEANGTDYFTVLIHEDATTFNNAVVCPMICLKSFYELDTSFEPYSKTNQELTQDTTALHDNTEVNGAVNKFIYPYNTTTKEDGGLTYTDNGDGTIDISAGTTTSSTGFWFEHYSTGKMMVDDLIGKSFKFSVDMTAPYTELDNNNARIEFHIKNSSGTNLISENIPLNQSHNEFAFTVPSGASYLTAMLWIASGKTVAATTLKPMFTLASYNGDYVPYAKSNRELTEDVTSLDAMYDGKTPSAVSDLDIPLTAGGTSVALTRHLNNTTNAPTTGGGLEITWSSSDRYGAQLTLTDSGLYFRTNSSGTISAWQKIST